MQVRVFCIICDKGLSGESEGRNYPLRVIQFMIAHMTDYKILSAHTDPASPVDKIEPSFGIETTVGHNGGPCACEGFRQKTE